MSESGSEENTERITLQKVIHPFEPTSNLLFVLFLVRERDRDDDARVLRRKGGGGGVTGFDLKGFLGFLELYLK